MLKHIMIRLEPVANSDFAYDAFYHLNDSASFQWFAFNVMESEFKIIQFITPFKDSKIFLTSTTN